MNKTVIFVNGGIVTYIATTEDQEFVIIDEDNLQAGDKFDSDSYAADEVLDKGKINKLIEQYRKAYER